SNILNLPPEIRLLIWEFAFGGNFIAIYKEECRFTHCLLNDSNSQSGMDVPIRIGSIPDAATQLYGPLPKHYSYPTRPNKFKVPGLLRSCPRTKYSEEIELLYSHNTFMFLQKGGLSGFLEVVLPERLDAIRSIHFHQFLHEKESFPRMPAFLTEGFNMDLHKTWYMPNLVHLSIFVQGPLDIGRVYCIVLDPIEEAHARMASPQPPLCVVRLPHSDTSRVPNVISDVDQVIQNSKWQFHIVRPSTDFPGDLADEDIGADIVWRCGVIYLPSGDGSTGFVARSYLVWTPMPAGYT
ncbi:hypothetical protein K458DRAFT_469179, partial [Lentithecium fluviatile CBS 122367]